MAFKISTGLVNIPIERDDVPVGTISFNPNNVTLREAFVSAYQEAIETQQKWTEKAVELDAMPDGEFGSEEATVKLTAISKLDNEAFEYFKDLLDGLFGKGSGTIVLGDSPLEIDATGSVFLQFMRNGIQPHLDKYVKEKSAKYVK